jgi:hypothetical protein
MSVNKENSENVVKEQRNAVVTGVMLVAFGLLTLWNQLFPLPHLSLLIVPVLGLLFLLWGITTREGGLLIPGGILTGIGAGIWLSQRLYGGIEDGGQDTAAVILISFAAGWALITILSAIFTHETMKWPLIPGAILGFIGLGLFTGGFMLRAVELAGRLWPIALIVAGLIIIIRQRRSG